MISFCDPRPAITVPPSSRRGDDHESMISGYFDGVPGWARNLDRIERVDIVVSGHPVELFINFTSSLLCL